MYNLAKKKKKSQNVQNIDARFNLLMFTTLACETWEKKRTTSSYTPQRINLKKKNCFEPEISSSS